MFAFIRKHQFLAMIFIVLVVISFVIFYTDRSHIGFDSEGDFGSIKGKRVSSRQYYDAQKEAMLSHFFRYQEWPRPGSFSEQMGWNMDRQIMERLCLGARMKELNIEIGDEAVARQVAQLFHSSQAPSVQEAYKAFLERNLKPQGLTDEDFRRFIKHELGIQQLGGVMGASGRLITPATAEATYKMENERVDTKATFFSGSNFVAQAKAQINPQVLQQYYSNMVQNYNLPERVQVSYVAFEPINYLSDASKEMLKRTDLAQQIDKLYQQRGPNFFKDEKGELLSPEKAKESIRDEVRRDFSQQVARKAAYEFASELMEIQPLAAKNLKTLADKKALKLMETEPFTFVDGPKGIKAAREFSSRAFRLSPQAPFNEEPVEVEGTYYVMAYMNRLPSQAQAFDVVKAKVEADYVKNRSRELAQEAGKSFADAVKTGLTAGKKFDEIAKEKKAAVLDVAPFSRNAQAIPELTEPNVSAFQYRSAATAHKAGEASEFVSAGDGGFVLYVEKYLPADETKMQAEIKEYLETARSRQANIAFGEWVSSELLAAEFVPPASRKK
jgi:hypothetical protein